MERTFPTIDVLGVPIAKLTPEEALVELERMYAEEACSLIAYANAHTLNLASLDPSYKSILRNASMVLNDGAGVAIAARLAGEKFPANLNGSDFNPLILRLAAENQWAVFLLGARSGVAKRAAVTMSARFPDLEVVGVRDGYWLPERDPDIAAHIKATGATLVMAALGNPRQEQWLVQYLGSTGARMGVGVGAFFDFAANEVARAPTWMNKIGVEWVFRLWKEPRRLWRRYILGNPVFVVRAVREHLKPGPVSGASPDDKLLRRHR